jgi:hydroxymethylbilane synthase
VTTALRVGTRGSPLAGAQTEEVLARLRFARPEVEVETVVIRTHGDEDYRSDLGTPADGKRAFTKRIEDALLDRTIDFAVHSLKDLPVESVEGLAIAAIPPRADPRDVLVANGSLTVDDLPSGTRIGTSSLRRRAQLLAGWPGVDVVDLRGNVNTRLRRLAAKDFDAIVIAAAGASRLHVASPRIHPFPPEVLTPAPGQGALAVEARVDDVELRGLLGLVDDPTARRATDAERALSARVGGSCNVPLGALATVHGPTMRLQGVVATTDGRRIVRARAEGASEDWRGIVERAAKDLLDGGAQDILREVAS